MLRVSSLTLSVNGAVFTVGIPFLAPPPEGFVRLIHWMTYSITEQDEPEAIHWGIHDGEIDPTLLQPSTGSGGGIGVDFTQGSAIDIFDLPIWAFGTGITPNTSNNQSAMDANPHFDPPYEAVNRQWLILHTLDALTNAMRWSIAWEDKQISKAEWVKRRHSPQVDMVAMGQFAAA